MFLFTNCQQHENGAIILDIGPHLFIDDYLIEEQSFLNRTINHPEKLPDPIIISGKEYDSVWQPYLSVLRDPQTDKFRMWYNTPINELEISRCHIGYIESDDGIHWVRPHQVLNDPHEIQFGVTVLDRGLKHENQEERFVLATYLNPGFRVSTSPDGITWTPISDDPIFIHNHDISTLFWDPIRGQYSAVVSHILGGFGDPENPSIADRRRIPHQTVSKDLRNWEPIRPIIKPKTGAPIEEGETQFYGMSGVITRGDLLIGLVKVLRDDLNATAGKTAEEMGEMNRKAAGLGYTVLAWSRDGVTWHRDHQPFIPRNAVPGTFDHAMAWGDEQIIVGDKTYIYYGGYEKGHKIARHSERHIGFASMKKDRYVSREADFNGGYLKTKPVIIEASKITVNAMVIDSGQVRLVDEHGNQIEGFEWRELIGDSIDHNIKWNKELSTISGVPVRLEFQLKNAELFGFELHQ